ncbi:MAG: T9SS type A sorting domain-containing protein [Polaribacter sp.]
MEKKYFKILLMVVVLFTTITISAQQGPTLYNFTADAQNWLKGYGNGTVAHDPSGGAAGDGALTIDRAANNNANIRRGQGGDDAFIVIDRAVYNYIKITYKNETAGNSFRLAGLSRAAGTTGAGASFANITVANIVPLSGNYVSTYVDISTIPAGHEVTRLDILLRANAADDPTGSKVIYDEIEFIETLPPATNSEFIKNPSFDDVVGGISHITGSTIEFSRSLDASVIKDGSSSFKMAFDKVQPTKINWNFTNYTHSQTATVVENSTIEVKMWVKTNRTGATAPFRIVQRTKMLLDAADVRNADGDFPSDMQTSTNTSGDWEELTFTYTAPGDFNKALFWFGVDFEAGTDINMNLNDVVWFDQMSVTITDPSTASVNTNVLEGVSVYPNPVSESLNINTLEGGKITLYNILGAKILSETTAKKNHTINTSVIESGIYLLNVVSDGKSFTQKIIVK